MKGVAHMGMSVGLVAPVWVPVPPTAYGGVEWIVHFLVEGLQARGHDVTLVAAGDSTTSANHLVSTYAKAPGNRMGETVPELVHAVEAYAGDIRGCDVIHDHTLAGPAIGAASGLRVLATVHGGLDPEMVRYLRALPGLGCVAISAAQRASAPNVPWAGVVHNAVQVDRYPFIDSAQRGDDLVFVGRMSPDKGVVEAIEVARALGRTLRIAAKMREKPELDYFTTAVEPLLGDDVEYVGELGREDTISLLGDAAALVFPIQWDEPFGMVMAEALACGTPVLALARGSVPEVIEDGVTGIVAATIPELIRRARYELRTIEPVRCREAAVKRFDVRRMVDEYEAIYAAWHDEGRDAT